jgi:hypothetical protein
MAVCITGSFEERDYNGKRMHVADCVYLCKDGTVAPARLVSWAGGERNMSEDCTFMVFTTTVKESVYEGRLQATINVNADSVVLRCDASLDELLVHSAITTAIVSDMASVYNIGTNHIENDGKDMVPVMFKMDKRMHESCISLEALAAYNDLSKEDFLATASGSTFYAAGPMTIRKTAHEILDFGAVETASAATVGCPGFLHCLAVDALTPGDQTSLTLVPTSIWKGHLDLEPWGQRGCTYPGGRNFPYPCVITLLHMRCSSLTFAVPRGLVAMDLQRGPPPRPQELLWQTWEPRNL